MAASPEFDYTNLLSLERAKLVKRFRLNFLGSQELILDYQGITGAAKESCIEWIEDNRLTLTDPAFGFKTYTGVWYCVDIIYNDDKNSIRQRFKIDSSLSNDVAEWNIAGTIDKSYFWRIVDPERYIIPAYFTDESPTIPSSLDDLEWTKQTGTINSKDFYRDATGDYSLWYSTQTLSYMITTIADENSITSQYFYNSSASPDGNYIATRALFTGEVTLNAQSLINTFVGDTLDGHIYTPNGTYNDETVWFSAYSSYGLWITLFPGGVDTTRRISLYAPAHGAVVSQNNDGLYGHYTDDPDVEQLIEPNTMISVSSDIDALNNIEWTYSGEQNDGSVVLKSNDGLYAIWSTGIDGVTRITNASDVGELNAPSLLGTGYFSDTYETRTNFAGGVFVTIVDADTLNSVLLESTELINISWTKSNLVESDNPVYIESNNKYSLWYDGSTYLITLIGDVGATPSNKFTSETIVGEYSGNGDWTGSVEVAGHSNGITWKKTVNDNGDGTYDVIISKNSYEQITGLGHTLFGAESSLAGASTNIFISGATTYEEANGEYINQGLDTNGYPWWDKGDGYTVKNDNDGKWNILLSATVKYNKLNPIGSDNWRLTTETTDSELTLVIEIGRNGPAFDETKSTSINSTELSFISDGGTIPDAVSGDIKSVDNIPLSNGLFRTNIVNKKALSQRIPAMFDMLSYTSISNINGIITGKNRTNAELIADLSLLKLSTKTALAGSWNLGRNSVSISLNNYGRYDYTIVSTYKAY